MKKSVGVAIIFIGIVVSILYFFAWKKPMTIAFVGELSGENAQMSVESRAAFLYVVDQYNRSGGLLGKKIEPYIVDDQNDNSLSRDVLKDLKGRGIHFVVGFNVSYMLPTIKKLADDGSFLIITPTVTTDELTGKDDMVIKMSPSNTKQIDVLFSIVKSQQLKRMLMLYDERNEPFSKPAIEDMALRLKTIKGEAVGQIGIGSNMSPADLQSVLLEANPDSLMVVTNGQNAGQLVQMTRILGFKGPIFLSMWSQSEDFLENAGRYTDNLYFSGIVTDYPDIEAYQLFSAHVHEKTKRAPDFTHMRTYNGTKILFEGIAQAKSLDPIKVKEVILGQAKFKGIDTTVVLDANGDRIGGYDLIVIENGKFVRAK